MNNYMEEIKRNERLGVRITDVGILTQSPDETTISSTVMVGQWGYRGVKATKRPGKPVLFTAPWELDPNTNTGKPVVLLNLAKVQALTHEVSRQLEDAIAKLGRTSTTCVWDIPSAA